MGVLLGDAGYISRPSRSIVHFNNLWAEFDGSLFQEWQLTNGVYRFNWCSLKTSGDCENIKVGLQRIDSIDLWIVIRVDSAMSVAKVAENAILSFRVESASAVDVWVDVGVKPALSCIYTFSFFCVANTQMLCSLTASCYGCLNTSFQTVLLLQVFYVCNHLCCHKQRNTSSSISSKCADYRCCQHLQRWLNPMKLLGFFHTNNHAGSAPINCCHGRLGDYCLKRRLIHFKL